MGKFKPKVRGFRGGMEVLAGPGVGAVWFFVELWDDIGGGRAAGGRVGGWKEVGLLASRTDGVGEKRWQAKGGARRG